MAALPLSAFACPRCRSPLEGSAQDELCCPADGLRFQSVGGIWRMLLPERAPVFTRFAQEYQAVRRAEGRGSSSPAYYQALPERDLSGRMPGDWQIRAAGYHALVKEVLVPLERSLSSPLRILDLGAGNGWLSNRLAQRRHAVAAVDLLDNDFDGLGCFRYYDAVFTPAQAEFDHLPFLDGSLDLAVFNASLHYSPDYARTLGEAQRVLGISGRIIVLDTPVYADPASGRRMVQERQAAFTQKYGFPSDALPSENYLTYARLGQLAAGLGADLKLITPSYHLGWRLRPLKARLLGRREPARFHLIIFSRWNAQ